MRLLDTLIFSLAVVFIIIGIYETMTLGIGQGYSWIMFSTVLFFYFTMRKKKG